MCDTQNRVEVLFRNVAAINVNTEMDNLTIRDPSEEELLEISRQVGIAASQLNKMAFVIDTSTSTGHIVASDFLVAEDEGDYRTPSSLLIEEAADGTG